MRTFDNMATYEEVEEAQSALLRAITKHAGNVNQATTVRAWAEAFAWLDSPNNSHGGGSPAS